MERRNEIYIETETRVVEEEKRAFERGEEGVRES